VMQKAVKGTDFYDRRTSRCVQRCQVLTCSHHFISRVLNLKQRNQTAQCLLLCEERLIYFQV